MPYCKQKTLCYNPFFNMRPMAFPALKKKKPGGGGRRVREKREEEFSYGVRKNLATGMNFIPLASSM